MLPDDRLRDLLQQAEDRARPEPEFMDGLFDDLLTRRRRHVLRLGRWELPRPVAYGALVPLVVVVAVVGFLGVTSPRSPSTGVGGVSPSPSASASPAPAASPAGSGDQGPMALVDAESETFRYLAPDGWDTFDASSPELPDVVNVLRLGQQDPEDDWTAADITARSIEFLADTGDHVVGEGAVAIDPASNGVDGALVISVGEFGSMTPAFAGTQLSENMGAATAAGDVTEPLSREIGLGEATSVSGAYPSGHVMHRAYVPIGNDEVIEIALVTKLGRDDSAPLFEAILNSIERATESPSSYRTCLVALDPVSSPALGETILFTGNGFRPGSVVVATDVGPTGTHPIEAKAPEQFQVGADGTFGPIDLTYSGPEEIGSHAITFTDGVCESTLEFTIGG
jgi:hypothetical protein